MLFSNLNQHSSLQYTRKLSPANRNAIKYTIHSPRWIFGLASWNEAKQTEQGSYRKTVRDFQWERNYESRVKTLDKEKSMRDDTWNVLPSPIVWAKIQPRPLSPAFTFRMDWMMFSHIKRIPATFSNITSMSMSKQKSNYYRIIAAVWNG